MPLLEEAGLAPAHDLHIVSLALDRMRAWIDADLPVVPVSANLARSTLLDPLLARRLEVLLRERRLPACLLHLEVSEEAWRLDPDQLRCALMRLQAAGFSVAVDDFGTASTSLSALEGAPVDVVKLDASLLRADPGCGAVVVGAAVRLVHELGMVVVAEGVEDTSQARFLEEAGADLLQGYLCSPPLDAEAFEGLLRDGGGLSAPSASSGARRTDMTCRRKWIERSVNEACPGLARRAVVRVTACAALVAVALWLHFAPAGGGRRLPVPAARPGVRRPGRARSRSCLLSPTPAYRRFYRRRLTTDVPYPARPTPSRRMPRSAPRRTAPSWAPPRRSSTVPSAPTRARTTIR